MRVLIFGGTGFVGRHVVHACLARGHEVTIVARGLSDAAAFPDAPIAGDRTDPAVLARVRAETFDLVFDSSGYLPGEVRGAIESIAASQAHYVFVSTISVIAELEAPRDEAARLYAPIDDGGPLQVERYGGLKVACEQAITGALGERALIVRPGRVLGPYDSDPRFPWLLRRFAEGGDVLAPGAPDDPVQLVDARDLGAWMVAAAERRLTGTFNAVGPPMRTGDFYELVRTTTGGAARLVWVPEPILVEHGVTPFSEAPFWLPAAHQSASRTDASRAAHEGLSFRPAAETVLDTWAWMQVGWDAGASVRAQKRLAIGAGLSPERERAILAAARG